MSLLSTLPTYFQQRIEVDQHGCWLWTGSLSGENYGKCSWKGKARAAHRAVWELLVGDIPEGMSVGHLCHDQSVVYSRCEGGKSCQHRRCVNPEHLALMTNAANQLSIKRAKGRFVTCAHDHDMTDPANHYHRKATATRPAYIECRTCKRIEKKAYRKRLMRRDGEDPALIHYRHLRREVKRRARNRKAGRGNAQEMLAP